VPEDAAAAARVLGVSLQALQGLAEIGGVMMERGMRV
jgi:hypothetical protein